MADALTTFASLALDAANAYIAADTYEVAERHRVLGSIGRKEKLPQKSSKTIRLVRFKRFDLPVAPLTEGVPPDAVQLVMENVDVSLDQWGIVGLLTDVAEITIEHDALGKMTTRCGQAIAEVIERETARTLLGGGTVRYATGVANRAALTGAIYLATGDCVFSTVTLRALGAMPTSDSGLYVGVMPPQVEGDVAGNDTTFTAAAQQTQLRALQYAEIGIWGGVRWKRSNFLPYFQSVAAPTTADPTATKLEVDPVDTGGTVTSGNYQFVCVARDKTTDYERRVSIQSANISSGTGDNDSFVIHTPTSVNYVYDVYMTAVGATTPFLIASRVAANTEFTRTTNPSTSAPTPPAAVGDTAGDEVFISFVFGEDAFFTVELNGMSTQSYITPPGPSWTNPLAQGRKVGTKVMWKCGIIDSQFYVRLESNSRYSAQLPA